MTVCLYIVAKAETCPPVRHHTEAPDLEALSPSLDTCPSCMMGHQRYEFSGGNFAVFQNFIENLAQLTF